MVTVTKVNGKMVSKKVKVLKHMQMEIVMMDSGRMTIRMVKAFTLGLMEEVMKVSKKSRTYISSSTMKVSLL